MSLNDLPRIHEREHIVTAAEEELRATFLAIEKKYNLTTAELISVVTRASSNFVLNVLKYSIRQERHGDVNKPGGLA